MRGQHSYDQSGPGIQPQTIGTSVLVPMAQNLFGALGVAVLATSIGYAGGLSLAVVMPYALMAAGTIFGIASATRAFSDEIRLVVRWWTGRHKKTKPTSKPVKRSPYELADEVLRDYYVGSLPISWENGMSLREYSRAEFDLVHGVLEDAGIKSASGLVLPPTLGAAQAILASLQSQGATWVQKSNGRVDRAYIRM